MNASSWVITIGSLALAALCVIVGIAETVRKPALPTFSPQAQQIYRDGAAADQRRPEGMRVQVNYTRISFTSGPAEKPRYLREAEEVLAKCLEGEEL